MAFLTSSERMFLRTVSDLGYCNPFLPERVEYERAILGTDFVEGESVWGLRVDAPDKPNPNIGQLTTHIETLVHMLRERLTHGGAAAEQDVTLYQDAALFFYRYRFQFDTVAVTKTPRDGCKSTGAR